MMRNVKDFGELTPDNPLLKKLSIGTEEEVTPTNKIEFMQNLM